MLAFVNEGWQRLLIVYTKPFLTAQNSYTIDAPCFQFDNSKQNRPKQVRRGSN